MKAKPAELTGESNRRRIREKLEYLKALQDEFNREYEIAGVAGDTTRAKQLMVEIEARLEDLRDDLSVSKAYGTLSASLGTDSANFTKKSQGAVRTKIAISTICGLVAVAHVLLPQVKIDMVTLILLVVAMLPWLAAVIHSVELPGGFKIELKDVKAAIEKVTAVRLATDIGETAASVGGPDLNFLREVAKADPNLALVGFRIEIERRLLKLAQHMNLPATGRSAKVLLRELVEHGGIDRHAAVGLADLIALGDQAAHGSEVSSNAAVWALDKGSLIVDLLDNLVARKSNFQRIG
jgi:DNA-binding transcriptional ArsR family regulator